MSRSDPNTLVHTSNGRLLVTSVALGRSFQPIGSLVVPCALQNFDDARFLFDCDFADDFSRVYERFVGTQIFDDAFRLLAFGWPAP